MGKTYKVVVLGGKGTGKTALLEQAIYGTHTVGTPLEPTVEDIYCANVISERSIVECFRFYDTAGLDCQKPAVPKHYYSIADAYILVFDITKWETFHCVNALKSDIDKHKDKKEMPVILALGNKADLEQESRQIDTDIVQKWAVREKVSFREVSATNPKSVMDAFSLLATKLTPVPQRTGLSLKFKKQSSSSASQSITLSTGPASDV